MKLFHSESIRSKLIAVILITTSVALILSSIGTILFERASARKELITNLSAMAELIAANSSAALSFEDTAGGKEILSALSANPWVVAGALRRSDGTPFARYAAPGQEQQAETYFGWPEDLWTQAQGPAGVLFNNHLCLGRTVFLEKTPVGSILLVTDLGRMDEQVKFSIMTTLLIMCGSFLLAAMLAAWLQGLISNPILRLTETMANIAKSGDYSIRATPHGHDELGDLVTGFNSLIEQSQSGKQAQANFNEDLEAQVKERTAEMLSAKEVAEAASAEKSQFLAKMSHEIRTPIGGVIGMLQLLKKEELSDRQTRHISTALSAAKTLLSVVGDVLDFSKIEAGHLELDHIEFELPDVLDQSVRLLAGETRSKHVELTCFVEEDVPRTVIGDSTRLQQVLINLVANAAKFTEQGEIHVACELAECSGRDALVRFRVRDTGPGIPPEQMETIFAAFAQGDTSMRRRYGGTGLGLAISRSLVELMGGEISVGSVVGKGSVFSFSVRLKLPEDAAPVPPRRISPAGMRLLVVDDSRASRGIALAYARSWGCEADEAESAAALNALSQAAAEGRPYALVAMDENMKGQGVRQLAKQIRELVEAQSPRLILFSRTELFNDEDLRRDGISAMVAKPIRASDLYDAMMIAVNGDPVSPSRRPSAKPAAASAIARGVRILVVEDHEINREVVRETLLLLGHQCDCISSGSQALDAVVSRRYDLVLMDCQMPGMDGYEATEIIRAWEEEQPQEQHIPIVALTAQAMQGDRDRCLAAGMDDYLTKPIQIETLEATLRKWMPITTRSGQTASAGEQARGGGSGVPCLCDLAGLPLGRVGAEEIVFEEGGNITGQRVGGRVGPVGGGSRRETDDIGSAPAS
nr:response regulator [Kiritimatiellota bacterium]